MRDVLIHCLILLIFFIAASSHTKLPLVDRKLCNNDPNHKWQQKCYNSHYNTEVPCDRRVIAPENCTQLVIEEDELSVALFKDIGLMVDSDSSIRRITIILINEIINDTTPWDDTVDNFLITRPMWMPVQEPFNVTEECLTYVFERYSQLWDPYYDALISRQFLSSENCARSKLVVGRSNCVHPGYSDVRKEYFMEANNLPAIFEVFVPRSPNKANGPSSVGFMSDADCPADRDNIWSCAFLPMTNCTLPDAIKGREHHHLEMYTNCSKNGQLTSTTRDFKGEILQEATQAKVAKLQNIDKLLPRFVYTSPFSHAANMFKFHGPEDSQVQDFLFMEFLFRKTAFYRRKVAEMFSDFRLKYGLGDRVRTEERRFVGVHFRRGDRVLPNENMTEICQNIIMGRIEGRRRNCTYANGRVALCPRNGNTYGCQEPGEVSIGEITLDGVVKEAELLIGSSIRNMIIFTEDLDWVNKEIREINRPDWKFFVMDHPKPSMTKEHCVDKFHGGVELHDFRIRSSGTLSGVYFHATIDLAQECDAFIGHFNSGVAMTLTGAMCNHHAGMEGVCPPVYNLKLGTE